MLVGHTLPEMYTIIIMEGGDLSVAFNEIFPCFVYY